MPAVAKKLEYSIKYDYKIYIYIYSLIIYCYWSNVVLLPVTLKALPAASPILAGARAILAAVSNPREAVGDRATLPYRGTARTAHGHAPGISSVLG